MRRRRQGRRLLENEYLYFLIDSMCLYEILPLPNMLGMRSV